jgi:hypothetical protein
VNKYIQNIYAFTFLSCRLVCVIVIGTAVLTLCISDYICGDTDSSESWYSKLNLHGYFQTRNYFDIEKDLPGENYYDFRNSLRIESSGTLGGPVKYCLSFDARFDLVQDTEDEFDVEQDEMGIWEGYLNFHVKNFNMRIGRQVIRWGKGDEINPTDVFTPEDFSEFLNYERAQRKQPALMLKCDYSSEPYRLELIWVPSFVPNILPEENSDWYPYIYRVYRDNPFPFTILDEDLPPKDESQIGALKLIKSTWDYDFSFSFISHYDQFPFLLPAFSSLEVHQIYNRQNTVAGDFETLIGDIGVRGEWAVTFNDYQYSDVDPETIYEKDVLNVIFGFDWTKRSNYINIQYQAQHIFEYEEELFEPEYKSSIVWLISRTFFRERLKIEAKGQVFTKTRDQYIKVQVIYKINDLFPLKIGTQHYSGPEDGFYGQYGMNDQLFAKISFPF